MGSCRRTCAFRQGPCRRLGGISIAPDPRVVELNDRFSAWVRVDMRLTDGCAVVAIAPRGKRKLGIYHKGPPRTVAEFANKWRDFRAKEPKLRKAIPVLIRPLRVAGLSEDMLSPERRRGLCSKYQWSAPISSSRP